MIRLRKQTKIANVPRANISRVKHRQQSLTNSIQELTNKIAELRQNKLNSYIFKLERSTECLKKLKGMQTKIQVFYQDESHQCKRVMNYLEESDKHGGNK
uniref:Uncharacterized protein n=1 Tax=Sipha flava TaxID=143950 RepID=A0A2S2QV87_9HEMI